MGFHVSDSPQQRFSSHFLKCWGGGAFEQSHLFEWAVLLSDKLDPSTSLMCPAGDGGNMSARETETQLKKEEPSQFANVAVTL